MKKSNQVDKYSAANYLVRMKEKEDEEKRIEMLVEKQNKREVGGRFVTITSDSNLFIPAGTQIFVPKNGDVKKTCCCF